MTPLILDCVVGILIYIKNKIMTTQQNETLEYFKKNASDWNNKAKEKTKGVNIIQQRNQFVKDTVYKRDITNLVIDIGCGTGDLVCDIANSGIEAIGIDFSDDMIKIAKKNSNTISKANFSCSSIFEYDFPENIDVISANGFIEYISHKELDYLFDLVYNSLNSGGSFIVGSRNRLFNAFSLNKYTEEELNSDNLNELIKESILIASGKSFNKMLKEQHLSLQKEDSKHTKTGIDVSTRFQYTPLQLIKMLKQKGFEAMEIYPIHIHSFSPSFVNKYKEIHYNISNSLQSFAKDNLELVPFASSFMLHVRKK